MVRRIALVLASLLLTCVAAAQGPSGNFENEADLALSVDGRGAGRPACAADSNRLECALDQRFATDARARELARALLTRHQIVVGVEEEHDMDGGFRGILHLVPELPVGRNARHLEYVLAAHDDIARTLAGLRSRAARPITYAHTHLVYRFFRSVGRTTPSAYASGLTIGYNLAGSLHRNAGAVRGTLVHEIFHLNDQARGYWSERELGPSHAAIVARCGGVRRCLAPYAPTATVVRGGTYYSFQPGNGSAVVEYGAEVATRFVDEHREMLERGRLRTAPFKCRTQENADAYARVSREFFGGVDLTPACR